MSELPELLEASALADALGRSRRWIYRQHEERGLPAYHVGRALLFDSDAVLSWLEGQRVGDWNDHAPATSNGARKD